MANSVYEKRREQMFPRLDARQIARLEPRGERAADRAPARCWSNRASAIARLLVVLSRAAWRSFIPGMRGEELLTELLPGDFAGEMSTLRGVPGFSRIRVREAGEVLAISEAKLRDAGADRCRAQRDLHARLHPAAHGPGRHRAERRRCCSGSRHSANTLRLREFLTRNNYPYIERRRRRPTPASQDLLDRFQVRASDEVPVVHRPRGRVLRNPSIEEARRFPAA